MYVYSIVLKSTQYILFFTQRSVNLTAINSSFVRLCTDDDIQALSADRNSKTLKVYKLRTILVLNVRNCLQPLSVGYRERERKANLEIMKIENKKEHSYSYTKRRKNTHNTHIYGKPIYMIKPYIISNTITNKKRFQ